MQKRKVRRFFCFFLTIIFIFPVTGCRKKPVTQDNSSSLQVVATIFPLYDFAREVGGEKASVTMLLPPGVEAHSFEPRPAQLERLRQADIFITSHPVLEPWAADLLRGIANPRLLALDASSGLKLLPMEGKDPHRHGRDVHANGKSAGHGHVDPHFWLDFDNAAIIVDNIAGALSSQAPAHVHYFQQRAANYKKKLAELDADYTRTLSSCRQRLIISGGHASFRYAAKKYNLTYLSAYHVSPNAEPTPRELIKIINLIRKHRVRYIFYEELLRPQVAKSLADETGAKLLLLHGAHNITKEDFDLKRTFIDIMQENLKNLQKGLLCPPQ